MTEWDKIGIIFLWFALMIVGMIILEELATITVLLQSMQ